MKVNSEHLDFAPLVAEALNVLAAFEFDLKRSAEQLNVSSSQLIKFLKREPAVFASVNQQREQAGLHRLK